MNDIFKDCKDFVIVYIDDISIVSKNASDHIDHLNIVFELLAENGIKLRMDKCTFGTDSIKHLNRLKMQYKQQRFWHIRIYQNHFIYSLMHLKMVLVAYYVNWMMIICINQYILHLNDLILPNRIGMYLNRSYMWIIK
eukprot:480283_1